jgi:hypothetical protein
MRRSVRYFAAVVALGVLVTIGVSVSQNSRSEAADEQPSLVEDFSYPDADRILATYGVKLVSGDGHILFADCATAPAGAVGLMEVYTTDPLGAGGEGLICFKVTGVRGQLSLQVPAVYEIRGDGRTRGAGHKAKAEVKAQTGESKTVDVPSDGSAQVGIGADPNGQPTTLLRLEVAP